MTCKVLPWRKQFHTQPLERQTSACSCCTVRTGGSLTSTDKRSLHVTHFSNLLYIINWRTVTINCMLHFDMNLYIWKAASLCLLSYSLLLCVSFLFWVCMFVILCNFSCYYKSCFNLYNRLPARWALASSYSGCLPCCVKLVLCYYCLLSL